MGPDSAELRSISATLETRDYSSRREGRRQLATAAAEHQRLNDDAEDGEHDDQNGRASARQVDDVSDQPRAFDGGKDDQCPIEKSDEQKSAGDSPEHEGNGGIMRMINEEGRGDGDRDAPANQKTGDADGELLQEERDESADQAKAEGEEKGKPKGRVLAKVRRELEPNRKAERGDEKPEEPATKKKKRDSDNDADDRQGEIHAENLGIDPVM